jgi:hypothetical protein
VDIMEAHNMMGLKNTLVLCLLNSCEKTYQDAAIYTWFNGMQEAVKK